uniref:Uncharacterized protein n=1 Tax=Candidatus Kentrum sp. SD TaxID=2126332 RepID=A0A451BKQ5_9GAMM|nr:MAG: hypothetical protein BECKSD772D_GA0070982_102634 [Candidatus Kentron sp. SD]
MDMSVVLQIEEVALCLLWSTRDNPKYAFIERITFFVVQWFC